MAVFDAIKFAPPEIQRAAKDAIASTDRGRLVRVLNELVAHERPGSVTRRYAQQALQRLQS